MRAPLLVGLAALAAAALASTSSAAQSKPYPGIPFPPEGGFPPYPYYPPPNATPPNYVPPPQYVPPTYGPSPRIKYVEGMATPPGYHLEENPRKGLVIAGAVVLGTTYALSAMIGAASSNSDDRYLMIPVAGPFFDLAARGNHGCATTGCDVFDPVIKTYLALDGAAQTAGGILLAMGFIFQKKEFVSDSYYGRTSSPAVATWTVVPQVAPGSRYGLMLRGALF
jgi:hypothetical protein